MISYDSLHCSPVSGMQTCGAGHKAGDDRETMKLFERNPRNVRWVLLALGGEGERPRE